MINKTKYFIIFFLAVSITCATFFSKPVYAVTTSSTKEEFNLISSNYKDIEYTYKENGIEYKVLETANKEFNKIHSRVYEKHNNKFQLAREFVTIIHKNSKNQIEVEKIENGIYTKDVFDIDTSSSEENIISASKSAKSGWEFVDSHNGSTGFKNFTYSVVVGLLITAVSGGLGLGVVASNVVGVVAGRIVSEKVPIIYYRRYVYYYRTSGGMVTKVKALNKFYYDKKHKKYFGKAQKIWTGKFPW